MIKDRAALVVAPVHAADDVRVYQKQVQSLLDCGMRVRIIARVPAGALDDRVKLDLVPNFSRQVFRFFTCSKFLRKFCSSETMSASLKDQGALAIRQDADYAGLSFITVLRGYKLNA